MSSASDNRHHLDAASEAAIAAAGAGNSTAAACAGRIWGTAITLGLAAVVVVNAVVYHLATAEPPALVRPDYYAAALDYDRVWTAEQHAAELGLRLQATGPHLHLSGDLASLEAATLRFTRPNDPRLDYVTAVTWHGDTLIPATAPVRGAWEVEFTARVHGKPLRTATRLFVP